MDDIVPRGMMTLGARGSNAESGPATKTNRGDAAGPALTQRTIRNIGLVAFLQITAAVINVVTLIILARLLTPFDFGIVGIAGVALGLIGQFTDFGLSAAVVQRRDQGDRLAEVAASIRLALAGILIAVSYLAAPFLAQMLNAPETADIIRVSSILWLLGGAGFVSSTLLWKEMAFRKLAFIGIVGSLVGAFVSIVLAFSGFSYWSIVLGNLVVAFVNLVMLWLLRPWRFHLVFDRRVAQDLLAYGKYVFAIGFLAFVLQNIDNAAVATVLGVTFLGFYYLAYRWATVVTGFVVRTVGRVLFPTYASIQMDSERVARGLKNATRALALVSFPAQIGILLVASEFVPTVLGTEWSAAVVPLQVLSFLGLATVVSQPIGDFFLATGRPRLLTQANLVSLIVLVPFVFPVAAWFGLLGVSVLVVAAYAVYATVLHLLLRRDYGIPLREMAKTWRVPATGVCVMALSVFGAKLVLPSGLVLLVVEIAVGALSYVGVVMKMDGSYIRSLARQASSSVRT